MQHYAMFSGGLKGAKTPERPSGQPGAASGAGCNEGKRRLKAEWRGNLFRCFRFLLLLGAVFAKHAVQHTVEVGAVILR